MLDLKQLRTHPQKIAQQLSRRGFTFDAPHWETLESSRKTLQTEVETLQAKRNQQSLAVRQAKRGGQAADTLVEQAKQINIQLAEKEAALQALQKQINFFLLSLPNLPDPQCPEGLTEADNQIGDVVGTPKDFDFKILDHIELGKRHDGLDLAAASSISSSRFMVLKGAWAKLHRVLAQLMLNTHVEAGYQEVYVPYLVNKKSLIGTGQLPKFGDDLFHVRKGGEQNEHYCLIPTAEVPVTNLLQNQMIDPQKMPYRFVCHSPCFRSEAGAYGKDTKGIIRQHQFDKVELVHIAPKTATQQSLSQIISQAISILKALELPYRTNHVCTGDLGFSAEKTIDIEVWLPSQQQYREISSCSSFGDFQARRLKMRFKNKQTKQTEIPHTFNGSALAVGRTLVALVENHQQADGSILLPPALQSIMGYQTLSPTNSP